MDGEEKRILKENPRKGANPLSIITYSWLLKLFLVGNKRDLRIDDLTKPLDEHKSSMLGEKISKTWEDELQRSKRNQNRNKKSIPSLWRVLFKLFGPEFALYGIILAVMQLFIRLLQPIALGKLLGYFSKNPKNENNQVSDLDAYFYAGVVIMCSVINAFVVHPNMLACMHIGMKMRIACCSLIYRKILRFSQKALSNTTIGQVTNLLSNDVSRFDSATVFFNWLWISPLQTIIVTYLMYQEVGLPAIIGVALMLLFIPLQGWLGKRSAIYRLKTAKRTDERVRLTNEIITGIQAIKMYSWEYLFSDSIAKTRKKEISAIRSISYIRGFIMSFRVFISRLSLFITLLAFVIERTTEDGGNSEENIITAERVFMLTAYYNILNQTMTSLFPQGIIMLAETAVSIERLRDFMLYDGTDPDSLENYRLNKIFDEYPEKKETNIDKSDGSIIIESACAKWIVDDRENTLNEINMRIEPGKLVAIVGQVGSGKSSLLNVILKELDIHKGNVDVQGDIAYACQEPWLFGGSIRTNILFGREMDLKKYKEVVNVCQLKRDFEILPDGDRTIVEERGVSLSGGQRARINLARAVYSDAPIYLFDDPLSAVDAFVGNQMFKECIVNYLAGKTRILVTHQTQFLKNVDKIIVMKEGEIAAKGTYHQLGKMGFDFGDTSTASPVEEEKQCDKQRHISVISRKSVISNISEHEINTVKDPEIEKIKSVNSEIYLKYIKSGGNCCLIFIVFLLFCGTQLFMSGGDYFMAKWVNLEEKPEIKHLEETGNSLFQLDRESCIRIYICISIFTVLITFTRSFSFFKLCMRASRRIHDRMFRNVLLATMNFFNKNPSGAILNRFSSDMGAVDDLIPNALIDCLQTSLFLIGIIIVVGISNPLLIIPTFFMMIISYFLRIFFITTSRSVKRLEGITRSPVFNHLNASLQGLTTVRSFHTEQILIKEFDQHQDLHSSAWYTFIASSRALGFWTDVICLLFLSMVTLTSLLLRNDSTTGGNVGLAITQSIGLTGMLQWGVRQSTELENQMTSVERISEYSDLEKESPLETPPDKKPENNWPPQGKIKFKNISMSYGPLEPPVLKNLNFTIEPKEKVGIVGRTGAGKSSIISALFRFAHLNGSIEIDGIHTDEISIHDLRSKISIIPQEPFLFAGTLRLNLDPFNTYPDNLLWAALEEVELKEMGLTAHVNEGGSNLSVGQRQLVCLARAIIKNNKILLLDEATANVDPKTDGLIQKTIRKKFADCTVLTIAHRLNTVMDSDKILVMDAGNVVEFDHPHLLLQNPEGVFFSMIQETGRDMAETLTSLANENFELLQGRRRNSSKLHNGFHLADK